VSRGNLGTSRRLDESPEIRPLPPSSGEGFMGSIKYSFEFYCELKLCSGTEENKTENLIVLIGSRNFGWHTGYQPAGGPSNTRNLAAGPKCTGLLSCVNFGVHTLGQVS
jgi:hypothetical protein